MTEELDDEIPVDLYEGWHIDSQKQLEWYARKLKNYAHDLADLDENYKRLKVGIEKDVADLRDRFEAEAVEFVLKENLRRGTGKQFLDTMFGRIQVVDKKPSFRQRSKTAIFEWVKANMPHLIQKVEVEIVPEESLEPLKELVPVTSFAIDPGGEAQEVTEVPTGELMPRYSVPGLEYTPQHFEASIRQIPKRRGMNTPQEEDDTEQG